MTALIVGQTTPPCRCRECTGRWQTLFSVQSKIAPIYFQMHKRPGRGSHRPKGVDEEEALHQRTGSQSAVAAAGRRRTAAAVHWVATKAPNGRAAGFFFGVWEEALGRNPPHLGQKPAVHLRNLGGSGWGALGQPVNVSETLQNWPESRRHISNDHMAPRERSLSLDGESVFSRRAGAWAKSASD